MVVTIHSVVFAFLCGIASAAWGPSDLVADIGDSKGDFVDLKLQWKAGSCPFARYHLTVSSPRSNDTWDGDTSGTNFTFADQEYWTDYTVTLKTSLCFVSDSLTAKIYTGPGSPHRVVSIDAKATATAANVTVREAYMPRIVDQYNVTYCSPASCKWNIIARNGVTAPGRPTDIRVLLNPLTPATTYNISVVPEIAFEEKKYTGRAMTSVFSTQKN